MPATPGIDRPRTGFDNVITIPSGECDWLSGMFVGADERRDPVRVVIDDGGVKFKVGNGTWTPPIGRQL
jgi:hypothetical protein